MKNYIGISRDHSASMRGLSRAALKDYNTNIEAIKEASASLNQDTIVSTVVCGAGQQPIVRREVVNSNINALVPLERYDADAAGTPLWDSVGELIELLQSVPDANDPNVSFVLMIITDGEENCSKKWTAASLGAKIQQLQATDRWTFTFRVPRRYGQKIIRDLKVPLGNIFEWDQTERGFEIATQAVRSATQAYYTARSEGATHTKSFFSFDMSNVSQEDVKQKLQDVTSSVRLELVPDSEHGTQIRDFCNKHFSEFVTGRAYYQMVKPEKEVQDYKKIIIKDKKTCKYYSGVNARKMLGLPAYGTIAVHPGNHGNFEIFIQSTSVNRKVVKGTSIVYCDQ